MKLNYAFSKKEIALILVLILGLLGLLYYRFVYLNISGFEEEYDTTDLEAQVREQQLHVIEWERMQDEILNANGKTATSSLATYDNQKQEINLLNDIFEPVIRYSFSFSKPVATGDTVRRNVNVSFTSIDYRSAQIIIQKLYNSQYRVLVRDISISPGDYTKDYLTALATEALYDQKARNRLEIQVEALMESGMEIDPYVLKVYNREPLTEAPITETTVQETNQETVLGMEENVEAAPSETVVGENSGVMGDGLVPDNTAIIGTDGNATSSGQAVAETQSETQMETEPPLKTLENSLVSVSMSMTFYETAYGAENLDGLIIQSAS